MWPQEGGRPSRTPSRVTARSAVNPHGFLEALMVFASLRSIKREGKIAVFDPGMDPGDGAAGGEP